MKKYSKYDFYKNCESMSSMKEAIDVLKEKDLDVKELARLVAKTQLYDDYFIGFGNTEEDEEAFQARCEKRLKELETEEDFTELVNMQYDELQMAAIEEYNNRRSNIDFRIKPKKDDKELELRLLKDIEYLSHYSQLKNIYISNKFRCDDSGIYYYDEKNSNYEQISEAVSIDAIYRDSKKEEMIEFSYIDGMTDKVEIIQFPAANIAKSNYELLVRRGIIINNYKLFTLFINEVKMIDKSKKLLMKGLTDQKYGFPVCDNELDLTRCIGLNNDTISKDISFAELDAMIFHRRGTVEGQLAFLDEVSQGKFMYNFQLMVAASLAGIPLMIINRYGNIVASPTYIFCGPTSIGKNLLVTLATLVWGTPSKKNAMIMTSDCSKAYMIQVKDRLNCLPFVIEDLQDLFDKSGIDIINEIVFSHSFGTSGGRCNSDGSIREISKTWCMPLIACSEEDVFSALNSGGISARYTVIDMNVRNGERLTVHPLKSYMKDEFKNCGCLGEEFINMIMLESPDGIEEAYNDITKELLDKGYAEKQANSFALLLLVLQLMKQYDLLPSSWSTDLLDAEKLSKWVPAKKIETPTERVYDLLCSHVLNDCSYVPYGLGTGIVFGEDEKAFEWRKKTPQEVRGRIIYESDISGKWELCDKPNRRRTLLLIPKQNLDQLFKYLIETYNIKGFGFNKNTWVNNGYMLAPATGDTYTFKNMHRIGITRPYDSCSRESHYAIIVKEDDGSVL